MSAPPKPAKGLRERELAMIHLAKKDLGLDDETYREMLWTVARVRSAKDLDITGRRHVLEHLKSRGWKHRPPRRAQPGAARMADDPQSRMIRGLWIELAAVGLVRDRSERALAAFVARQTGVDRLEWLNVYQASQVIEALKLWLTRASRGA